MKNIILTTISTIMLDSELRETQTTNYFSVL